MAAQSPDANGKSPQEPRLLDQFRAAARAVGHLESWIELLASWVVAFIIFHGKRHRSDLDLTAVAQFLEHVVQTRKNPLTALETARTALTLLYGDVVRKDLGPLPLPRPPHLLDQMAQVLRLGHYSPETEKNYVQWAKRYILFHDKRHPRELGPAEVSRRDAATVVALTA